MKDFTNYEMVLTTYLKDEIDLSNMSIKDELEKKILKKIFLLKKANRLKTFLYVLRHLGPKLFLKIQ